MELMSAREFEGLTSFVREQYGINLLNNKAFAKLRIRRLMDANHCGTFAEYFSLLRQDRTGEAMTALISNLTISYSLFNRDPSHFDFLRRHVLPLVEQKERQTRDLRIWSAGCATGEEPYTIAMTVQDYFGIGAGGWDTKILASDISVQALKRAIDAIYPAECVHGLSAPWLRDYFTHPPQLPGKIQVARRIREQVIFKRMNLVGPAVPFRRKFHCVFCRNVMLYFDEEIKAEVIRRLDSVLEPGGFLFIGTTETIDRAHGGFRYVQPSIYRKE